MPVPVSVGCEARSLEILVGFMRKGVFQASPQSAGWAFCYHTVRGEPLVPLHLVRGKNFHSFTAWWVPCGLMLLL